MIFEVDLVVELILYFYVENFDIIVNGVIMNVFSLLIFVFDNFLLDGILIDVGW